MTPTLHNSRAKSYDRPRKSVAGRFAPTPVLALTAWSLALPIVGCYRAVPVARGATPPIGDGTLVLTAEGTNALASRLGGDVREIEGTILRVTADSLEVLVAQTITTARERFTQTARKVTIARPLIAQVHEKQFSRRRTWTLIGVAAAVLAFALSASGIASSSGDGGQGPGPIQP